jgi:hypothetical protein
MVRKELERWNENGVRMVAVPLGAKGERFAELEEDSWDQLLRMGLSQSWHLVGGYVQATAPLASGKMISPARVLLGCGPGTRIKYKDGDPKNLRRDNLIIEHGGYSVKEDRLFITPPERRLGRRYGQGRIDR